MGFFGTTRRTKYTHKGSFVRKETFVDGRQTSIRDTDKRTGKSHGHQIVRSPWGNSAGKRIK